ncbi:unnamed protein product [Gulo gulo]|uniref:Immunoglobulin V-set domain-containing protein n=1 Tax=Gulo gulo TaxID=48420 RepID=A0A9X9PYD4_GULGU|nr:unnamed protein product [Gulo gulo]
MLLSYGAGSLSQPVLTQPPFLSASLGTTARLTFTLSNGFSVRSYNIYWCQQKPGSPPWYLCATAQTQINTRTQGSPVASLAPRMPQPVQGFCSSLCCSLRMRLTITVLYIIAVAAAIITHSVSDNEEVRQTSEILSLSLFNRAASVEGPVG